MSLVFKTSYGSFAELPAIGNIDGDLRYVADTGLCYRWDELTTTWILYATVPALVTSDGIGIIGALRGTVLDVPAPSSIDGAAITTGTVATARLDTGTSAGKLVVLNGSAQLPAVSAALLTNVPAPAAINASTITSGTLPTARLDSGVGPSQVVVLNGSSQLPAVSAALLTNVPAPAAIDASTITSGALPTARLDVGTSANQVVQLNGSAQLPAVSAALLTNVPAPSSGVMLSSEFTYDFAVNGGAISTITLTGTALPANVIVHAATLVNLTTPVGGNSVSLKFNGVNLDSLAVITNGASISQFGTSGTPAVFFSNAAAFTNIAATTSLSPTFTIAGSVVTAGKFRLILNYIKYTP